MTDPERRADTLRRRFGGSVIEARCEGADLVVVAGPECLLLLCDFLSTDPDFLCDYPADLFATDTGESLVLRYRLFSTTHRLTVRLLITLARDNPEVSSMTQVWPGVNWFERECYDLFGVTFRGHPDMPCPGHMRILLPEDWEGHPFRKDYTPVFSGDPLHGPQETN